MYRYYYIVNSYLNIVQLNSCFAIPIRIRFKTQDLVIDYFFTNLNLFTFTNNA